MVHISQQLGLLLILMQLSNFAEGRENHKNHFATTTVDNTHKNFESRTRSSIDSLPQPISERSTGNNGSFLTETNNMTRSLDPPCTRTLTPKNCDLFGSTACINVTLDLNVFWRFKCNRTCPNTSTSEKFPLGDSVENETCVHSSGNDYQRKEEGVRMITSCPSNANTHIKEFCENFLDDLLHDLWLMTPVYDFTSGKTYKNIFCAVCHKQPLKNITFWELFLECFESRTATRFNSWSDPDRDGDIISRLHPRHNGFWKYTSAGSAKVELFCFFHPVADPSQSTADNCLRTAGGLESIPPNSCNDPRRRSLIPLNPKKSEPNIKFTGCHLDSVLQDKDLHAIVCSQPGGKAKCRPMVRHCLKSVYHSLNETSFDDPRHATYERYRVSKTLLYICGRPFYDTIVGTWVPVAIIILVFLLRMLVVGFMVYELIFLWLPAKSTMDRSLGSLGFTLLVQSICMLVDRKKNVLPCNIVACVWHYSMLSSFTWIVILSYDCWLNLRQLFQVYQLISEFDVLQFWIYFGISQIIPVLATSAALIFDSSPADWYCQPDLGLDRYECLLAQVPGFTNYFLIPACCLFALNIYYLMRIGILVFPRRIYLKEVRQKFTERSGFAMMMSPTWLIGSLLMLSHYEFPLCDVPLLTVHILQTTFFLIYAFYQWLDRILQKYEEIELSIFGEQDYCPMTPSVLPTEDRQLLAILEGNRLEQGGNQNLYS